ncbi:hypothetical protein cand_027200 [Cryptosporidium andersoni]|uniref:Uncharacterized protein n=1 Tax=Cryptosporidium andersoni TaxID=117008 RepID=A0A1J4MU31_9CRYT|nr:hypothetical protein cand_027200 [Cryptosporidium andersoni]
MTTGLTENDINSIIDHLIRTLSSYVRFCTKSSIDIRAPIIPLFEDHYNIVPSSNNEQNAIQIYQDHLSNSNIFNMTTGLYKLASEHYQWSKMNYVKVRRTESSENKNKNNTTIKDNYEKSDDKDLKVKSTPYLDYLSSQYDGIDSPIVQIITNKHGNIVMQCILIFLNNNSTFGHSIASLDVRSKIVLLLSDIIRALKRLKILEYSTTDFHVLVDILIRELIIMRDLGFACFEFVSCLNIVTKCIASTPDKYRWGEATTLLSVAESLIDGFGVKTP